MVRPLAMRLLYLMDPLEGLLPDKDTTFAFLRAGTRLGHENLHAAVTDLTLRGGELRVRARRAFVSDVAPHHRYGEEVELAVSDVDAVLIRKDPPFDASYLYTTLLLEHVRGKTLVVNDPRALRDANEKLYAMQFGAWMPRTLVSADRDVIRAFVDDVGGKAVIKPLDGAGGWGVMGLRADDSNGRAIVDMLTGEGKRLAMVQEFLPRCGRGTSACCSSMASRSARSSACRGRTTSARTSTWAAASSRRSSPSASGRSSRTWARSSPRSASTSSASTSSASG